MNKSGRILLGESERGGLPISAKTVHRDNSTDAIIGKGLSVRWRKTHYAENNGFVLEQWVSGTWIEVPCVFE